MSEEKNLLLLKKHLRNECSDEEQILIAELLKSEKSVDLLEKILSEEAEQDWAIFNAPSPEVEGAQDWRVAINEKISFNKPLQYNVQRKPLFMRYAAVWITLLAGLCLYGFNHFSRMEAKVNMVGYSNPNGQRSMLILPDSSVVYLGAGSTIQYPETFAGDRREISLSGEAFFKVARNVSKPFIIHTGNIQTKVLGTSFKIKAFKDHPVSVEVVTGKVSVDHLQKGETRSLAILTPGQGVSWYKGAIKMSIISVNEVSDWKEAKLVFNNSSFAEIAEELERWYDLKIIFKNSRKLRERMTVTLDGNKPANKVLDILTSAGHCSYIIKNKTVTIQ